MKFSYILPHVRNALNKIAAKSESYCSGYHLIVFCLEMTGQTDLSRREADASKQTTK